VASPAQLPARSALPNNADDPATTLPARQVIAELSHDLRQPLTTITMNLQCAMRLLRSPAPRLDDAIEALSDCLHSEAEIAELVNQAQRRIAHLLNPPETFILNELVEELLLTMRVFEPSWTTLVSERLDEPSPIVWGSPARLRMALLTLMRRMLATGPGALPTGSLQIETQSTGGQGELTLRGIPRSCLAAQLVPSVLDDITAASGRLGGGTLIEMNGQSATLCIFLPPGDSHFRSGT
jgi:C4-dicarboxylate-specific signal transduction histidine kinase